VSEGSLPFVLDVGLYGHGLAYHIAVIHDIMQRSLHSPQLV